MKSGASDQSPERSPAETRAVAALLEAYGQGWFPMAQPGGGGVEWVQPSHRAIIPLDERFHVPSSLAQRVRSRRFTITTDVAFEAVIRACAAAPRRAEPGSGDHTDSVWLAPEIIDAFVLLHKHGHAHSIEAWLPRSATPAAADSSSHVLVGGLYGLALGRVFCGESMFHNASSGGTDASKVCLVHLVSHLRSRGFALLDAQLANPHTAQFGMFEIPRAEYLKRLSLLSRESVGWLPFDPYLV